MTSATVRSDLLDMDADDFPRWYQEAEPDAEDPLMVLDPVQRLIREVLPVGKLTITVEEMAAIVGMGRTPAYDAVKRGDIPSRRVNGRIFIPVPDLLRWLGVDLSGSQGMMSK